jgi:hypothetical protein
VAMNVMRLGGGVTLVAIGGFLTIMWARERRRRRQRLAAERAPSVISRTRSGEPGDVPSAGAHPS